VYFNMSVGEGDTRGPWNNEPTFEFREAQAAVDGGSGLPEVLMEPDDLAVAEQAAKRLQSDPDSDPVTGAMLGMEGGTAPKDKDAGSAGTDPKAAKSKAKAAKSGAKKAAPDTGKTRR
jgi:Mn-containing catalase